MTKRQLGSLTAALACAALVAGAAPGTVAVVAADNDGVIRGTVRSADGPEAGVWVIAETDDLETVFRKIVVTDDDGRYVLPELPDATFDVWVRGYGLVDSEPVAGRPDTELDLTAVVAATPQEAAQVYPSTYWLSLINLPGAHEFPGTGPEGNGINPQMASQAEWINNLKGCQRCHQVGSKRTREIPDLDDFDSARSAWADRVQRGQRGSLMNSFITRFGTDAGLDMLVDWTDRIAAGEAPPAPPRPQGIERNVVLTMWNWGDNVAFVHDEIATDKRNPRVNANGPLYGVDIGNDFLLVTDTLEHSSKMIKIPLRENDPPVPSMFQTEGFKPWRDFGAEAVWVDPANPHNPMIDAEGRVWLTTRVRHPNNPDWCREGSDNAYARVLPGRSRRPPHRLLRSGDRGIRAHRHLLRHAPPAVRRGRQRHAVLQRRRRRHRLARHEALRRDRRRAARPGLVPDRHRHQRRRRHHQAVERAGPARQPRGAAVRPGAGHPRAGRRLRHHRQPARRRGLDCLGRLPRPDAAPRARRQPAGDVHQRALHGTGGEGLPHPRARRRP